MGETIEGRLDEARLVAVRGFAGQERRRPGRQADVSPALIPLMRRPTASVRVRVALYDAPGFLLPQGGARHRVDAGFLLRAGGMMVALAGICGAAVEAMCLVWG